ncbi:hypothetical protein PG985_014043 [Apiospora marii]|uniref:Uncharacterized protein n=1 Tax=Apiospora marii TaxID=335849 RepID=A0ABR1R641_9PEZI
MAPRGGQRKRKIISGSGRQQTLDGHFAPIPAPPKAPSLAHNSQSVPAIQPSATPPVAGHHVDAPMNFPAAPATAPVPPSSSANSSQTTAIFMLPTPQSSLRHLSRQASTPSHLPHRMQQSTLSFAPVSRGSDSTYSAQSGTHGVGGPGQSTNSREVIDISSDSDHDANHQRPPVNQGPPSSPLFCPSIEMQDSDHAGPPDFSDSPYHIDSPIGPPSLPSGDLLIPGPSQPDHRLPSDPASDSESD